MAITALGKNLDEALNKSYEGIKKITWEGKTYRTDIGFDLKRLGQ
jgi:phosphoribosylamine--glycine ligase